jgi:GntR family transcriptional repressor for pyruvate dehydrogenase complex
MPREDYRGMRDTDVAEKMWNRRTIIADIEQMIASGLWPPGTKLPTREDMARHYGVGKTAIDGVIDIMKAAGTLRGVQGGRVYVAGGAASETTGPMPTDTDGHDGKPNP